MELTGALSDQSEAFRYEVDCVRLCFAEDHFVAKAMSAGPDSGPLGRIAGSKSAPFGQTRVWTSGSM